MAVRLQKALGGTADTWLRMQMNYDLAQIRARASSIKEKRLAPARTLPHSRCGSSGSAATPIKPEAA